MLFLALPVFAPASTMAPADTPPDESRSESEDEKARPDELRYSAATSAPLLAGAIASVVLPSAIHRTPVSCRWCDGANPNAIDRWARKAKWEDPCRAGRLSYWTFGAAGAIALLPMSHESRREDWLVNAGAVADSVAVTVMLTQVAKYTVRRERPSASTCHPERPTEPDRNLSFFSGHTAIAFAMVASAREAARLRGHPRNQWLWMGGAASVATGYLRVAGDRHHLLDVTTGAAVGYLVGRWVPRHLHGASARGASEAPAARFISPTSYPPLLGYSRPVTAAGRNFLVQVGKGPGRSVRLGISF